MSYRLKIIVEIWNGLQRNECWHALWCNLAWWIWHLYHHSAESLKPGKSIWLRKKVKRCRIEKNNPSVTIFDQLWGMQQELLFAARLFSFEIDQRSVAVEVGRSLYIFGAERIISEIQLKVGSTGEQWRGEKVGNPSTPRKLDKSTQISHTSPFYLFRWRRYQNARTKMMN